MDSKINFQHCRGWLTHPSIPTGVQCPPNLTYPLPPPSPIKILFLAWNPPGSNHFWNNSTDSLRTHLKWVLSQEPFGFREPDFLGEFQDRGCYLVHAARCWVHREIPQSNIAETCGRALLGQDIQTLQPRTLCILGRIPLYAARTVITGLPHPSDVAYQKGSCIDVGEMKIIITVLPHHYDRKHTLNALRLWWT